jgi:hypothetical protein
MHFKAFLRDYYTSSLVVIGLVATLLGLVEIVRFQRPPTEVVFLHVSLIAGVNITGVWRDLFLFPVGMFIAWCGSTCWAYYLHRTNLIIARILLTVTACVALAMWWGIHMLLFFNS